MKIILGTMNFGPQVDAEQSRLMVQRFCHAGYSEIDTAYVYNGGDSERFLGEILAAPEFAAAKVATKVNPKVTGRLDAAAIKTQFQESLARLQSDSVETLYLHFPDPNTPIDATLQACAELHAMGKFTRLGLSNFAAWEVVDIWHRCERLGCPQPQVYQGLYNSLSRNVEPELIPALRRLGMSFYAYNPLAGGILSGKYRSFDTEPEVGRFTVRPNYRDRYWKKSVFESLEQLAEACDQTKIPMAEAAFRWLMHHSHLDASCGDGLLLGTSSVPQLETNLRTFAQGELPPRVVETFDIAWEAVRPDSPDYFRTPDTHKSN